ncbi:TF29 [Enterospora canceri]|uniref:RNA-directed DNA polymerase n=1 Tax=Enterospora canceri TaxID=1081671 RepID=A0A1Y1S639_9MICR|nr:TF29 [Enterospora canceri]
MKRCFKEDEEAKEELQILVDQRYHHLFARCALFEKCLEKLTELTYNREMFGRLLVALEDLRAAMFPDLHGYREMHDRLIERTDMCINAPRRLGEFEKEDLFVNGLRTWMKEEWIRLGDKGFDAKIGILIALERNRVESWNQESHYTQQRKYCPRHRSYTHGPEECFDRTRTSNSNKGSQAKNAKDNIRMIQEEKIQCQKIGLGGLILEEPIQVVLDTGARLTYIRKEAQEKLKLPIEKVEATVHLANGRTVQINEQTETEMELVGISHTRYKVKALVLPGLTEDLIVGLDFMCNNGMVLDLKKGIISVDGYELLIEEFQDKEASRPENLLVDNLRQVVREPETLEDVVQGFKATNPILGNIDGQEHEIHLTSDKPVHFKPYGLPFKVLGELKQQIKDMLDQGLISRSSSKYGSPSFGVLKKNGAVRMVTDFRALNQITEKEVYPFPNVKDQLQGLHGRKVFSQIDLDKGFYQIRIRKEDRHKTGFVLPFGQYEYNRLPFGMANSPRSFQRAMDGMLRGLDCVRVFVDDVLIASSSLDDHVRDVKLVLERLQGSGAKINFEKSHFGLPQVNYLGMIISEHGIRADSSKIHIARMEEAPKNAKEARRLLWLLNWFRDFVPRMSDKVLPLTKKMKLEKGKFFWDQEDESMRKGIFEEIEKENLLRHVDPSKPFELQVDASKEGISGVLLQEGAIVGIYSHKLQGSELNYTIVEKEFYAIVRSIQHFHKLVWGSKIKLKTDSKNNSYNQPAEGSRMNRWKSILNEYEIELEHIEGIKNSLADYFSREGCEDCLRWSTEQGLFAILFGAPLSTEDKSEGMQFLEQWQIYLSKEGRVIVPRNKGKEVAWEIHERTMHAGETTMWLTISRYLTGKELRERLREVSMECQYCMVYKNRKSNYGFIGRGYYGKDFNDTLASDLVGPFVRKTDKGRMKVWVISFIDLWSRCIKLRALTTINSRTVLEAFESWIKENGKPRRFLSDNGGCYTSKEFKDYLKTNGIQTLALSAYNPRGNGIAERYNQRISLGMRITKDIPLDTAIERITQGLNETANRSTGYSPKEVVHQTSIFNLARKRVTISKQELKERNMKSQGINQKRENDKRVQHHWDVGEVVYVKVGAMPGKMDSRQLGPFRITKVLKESGVLEIENTRKRMWVNQRRVVPLKVG